MPLTATRTLPRIQHLSNIIRRGMTTSADDVILETVKNKGIITLNRPKALNALNLSMVRKIYPALKEWEKDKDFVLIKGAGEKAFCSGGDVRAVTQAGLKGDDLGKKFFREEYTLNNLIGTYHIPYIALIDGITMGGGVGLSVHGSYRVATERTLFAMPETAIGLFSDVGGSYFLSRLGGKLGLYLALTGERLKGKDVLKAGVATHFCDSTQLKELENKLIDSSGSPGNIEEILNTVSKTSQMKEDTFSLNPYIKQINDCFAGETVEDIFTRLESDGSEWAKKTLTTLQKASPTSLKIIKRELEEGATKSLQECLQMEYRLAVHCLEGHDFYEGVRAVLIDKDQQPKWNPPTLKEVTDKLVDQHFRPLPEADELKF